MGERTVHVLGPWGLGRGLFPTFDCRCQGTPEFDEQTFRRFGTQILVQTQQSPAVEGAPLGQYITRQHMGKKSIADSGKYEYFLQDLDVWDLCHKSRFLGMMLRLRNLDIIYPKFRQNLDRIYTKYINFRQIFEELRRIYRLRLNQIECRRI